MACVIWYKAYSQILENMEQEKSRGLSLSIVYDWFIRQVLEVDMPEHDFWKGPEKLGSICTICYCQAQPVYAYELYYRTNMTLSS